MDCSVSSVDAVVNCLSDSLDDFQRLANQIRRITQSHESVAWEVRSLRPRVSLRRASTTGSLGLAALHPHEDSSNSHWEQQQQQQQQQAAAERGGVPSSKLKPLPLQHQVLHQQQQQQLQQQQPHSPSGSLERGRSPAVVHATASGAVYGTVARGSPAGTLGQSCHEPPPIPHKSPPRLEGSPSIQLPTEPVSSKPGAAEGSSSSQHGTSVFQSPSPALEFAKGLPTLQVADGTDPVTLASGQVLEEADVLAAAADAAIAAVPSIKTRAGAGAVAANTGAEPAGAAASEDGPSADTPDEHSSPGAYMAVFGDEAGNSDESGASVPNRKLMLLSPRSRKRTPQETQSASNAKQERAERLRELQKEEQLARMARAKETRQIARSIQEGRIEAILNKFEEKIARSEQLRLAHLSSVVQRASDETRKVAEVAFINQLLEEDKKLSLLQKLKDGGARRQELLQEKLARQRELALVAEEAAERRRLAEAARQAGLSDKARKKEQAQAAFQLRLEEERRAAAAAREAAKEAQKRILQELAAARAAANDARRTCIEDRLREAVARRASRLEMVKERAALFAGSGALTSTSNCDRASSSSNSSSCGLDEMADQVAAGGTSTTATDATGANTVATNAANTGAYSSSHAPPLRPLRLPTPLPSPSEPTHTPHTSPPACSRRRSSSPLKIKAQTPPKPPAPPLPVPLSASQLSNPKLHLLSPQAGMTGRDAYGRSSTTSPRISSSRDGGTCPGNDGTSLLSPRRSSSSGRGSNAVARMAELLSQSSGLLGASAHSTIGSSQGGSIRGQFTHHAKGAAEGVTCQGGSARGQPYCCPDGSKVSQQQQQQQLLSPSSSVSEALQQQQHQQPVLTQRSASFSGGTVSKRPKPPLPAQQQHQHQQDDCSSNIPAAAAAHSDAASSGHCGTITDSPAQPYGAAPERPGGTQPFSLDPGGGLQDAREVASKAKGKLLGEGADQALASSQADAPDVGFFKATDSKHTRAEAAAASLPSGPVPPSPPAKHHHHKPHHHPPLCSSGMHVHGAMNAVNRLKGMRRRSARVLARIKALRRTPQQPAEWGLLLSSPEGASLLTRWTQLVQACGSHPGMAVALGDPIATTQSPSNKAIDAGSSRTSCTPHAPPACGEIRQSSCNSRDAELGSRTGKQSVRSAACGSSAHAAVDSKSDRGGSGVPQSQPSRHALFEEKSAVHDCQEAGGAAAHWQELIGQTSHTRVDGSTQIPTTNTAPGTTTTTTSGTATAPQTPGNAAATAPAPAAASRPCHTGGSVEEFATAAGSAEERAAAAAAAQSAEKRATANGLGVERAIADGSAEERATVARSAEEHATVDGSSKENAEPSTSTSPAHASSKSLPVLGRAQRAAALHLAISAAASDLSRPALAEVAMAAAWPSGLLALLCAEAASAGSTGGVAPLPPWDPVHPALDLLVTLMQEPPNTDAVLAAGMFPGLVRAAMRAFDSCNGGDPGGASGAQAQGQADPYRHLTALLKVVTLIADQPANWPLQPNAPSVSPQQQERLRAVSCNSPQPLSQQQQQQPPVQDQQHQQQYQQEAEARNTLRAEFALAVKRASLGHQTQRNLQQEACHTPEGSMQDGWQAGWGDLREMHNQAVAYLLSSGLIHRMSEAFNLCDQILLSHAVPESDSKRAVPPLPSHIIQGLHLLEALTSYHLPSKGAQGGDDTQKEGSSKSSGGLAGGGSTSKTIPEPEAPLGAAPVSPTGTEDDRPELQPHWQRQQHQQRQHEEPRLPVPTTPNMASLSLAFQETSLVGLPMLLTAAMLHAAPKCLPYEAVPRRLPSNFLPAALSVVRVLNNFARLDLPALQSTLSSPALHVGFCHLMAFLTSFATNIWPPALDATTMQQAFAKGTGRLPRRGGVSASSAAGTGSSTDASLPGTVAPAAAAAAAAAATAVATAADPQPISEAACTTDTRLAAPATQIAAHLAYTSALSASAAQEGRVGPLPAMCGPPPADVVALLNEVLLLLGHFSLLAPTCQGMLTWGRENSILHRLAAVPPCYFTHPQLAQIMLPTLAAACYGDERLCSLMAATVTPKHVALALGQEQQQQQQQQQQILTEQLPPEVQQQQQQQEATSAYLPDRYALESRFPSAVVMQMSSFFKAFGGAQDAPLT